MSADGGENAEAGADAAVPMVDPPVEDGGVEFVMPGHPMEGKVAPVRFKVAPMRLKVASRGLQLAPSRLMMARVRRKVEPVRLTAAPVWRLAMDPKVVVPCGTAF